MNIQFNYLYRDGGNYKQLHHEVFSNQHNIPIEDVKKRIQNRLIDGEYFYHQKWGLKDLHYFFWDNDIDVMWHEFESVDVSTKAPTKYDIFDFLTFIEST